jgi:SPP1 gp7 family putative phage head morphogenesis protein
LPLERIVLSVVSEAEKILGAAGEQMESIKRRVYLDVAPARFRRRPRTRFEKRVVPRWGGIPWWEAVRHARAVEAASEAVEDALPEIEARDYATPLDLFMNFLRQHLDQTVARAALKLGDALSAEERRHRRAFTSAVRAGLGADVSAVLSDRDSIELLKAATSKGVALIQGLSDDVAKGVEFTILDAATRGQSRTALSERLRHVMGINRRRARMIAKDQAATFNGNLNKLRQNQVGIDEYMWETERDERVRHDHAQRDGKIFSWDDPPDDGHPGEPVNCRCTAVPFVRARS